MKKCSYKERNGNPGLVHDLDERGRPKHEEIGYWFIFCSDYESFWKKDEYLEDILISPIIEPRRGAAAFVACLVARMKKQRFSLQWICYGS